MTDDDETPTTVERWTYLGVMESSKSKRCAVWRRADGITSLWYALKPHTRGVVGYLYDATIVESESSVALRSVAYTGQPADDIAELQLLDRDRRAQNELEKLEAKARRDGDPALLDLLAHVERYSKSIIATAARDALVRALTRAVYRA